jgi:hypothetical protein
MGLAALLALPADHADERMRTLYNSITQYWVDLPSDAACDALLTDVLAGLSGKELRRLAQNDGPAALYGAMSAADRMDKLNAMDDAALRATLLAEFLSRQQIVGPILPNILRRWLFLRVASALENESWTAQKIANGMSNRSIDHIPREVTKYAAPRLRPGVVIPDVYYGLAQASMRGSASTHSNHEGTDDGATEGQEQREPKAGTGLYSFSEDDSAIYEMTFHSAYIRNQVRRHITTQEQREALSSRDGEFHILERYVEDCLRKGDNGLDEWSWYSDPGCHTYVTAKHKAPRLNLPRWERSERIVGRRLARNVGELDDRAVYIKRTLSIVNHPLYTHLLVQHPSADNAGKGTVYLLCTSEMNNDHVLSEAELIRALKDLHLQRDGTGHGGDYKVVLVCLNDASDERGNGVGIDMRNVGRWRKHELLTVQEWGKTEAAARYAPVEAVLVRVPAFPGLTSVLPARRKKAQD